MHSRVVSKDEELGKRDDDFRPKRKSDNGFNILRWRKRRILVLALALFVVYLFVSNRPTDMTPVGRPNTRPWTRPPPIPGSPQAQPAAYREPTGAPPKPKDSTELEEIGKHYYNGQIRFYNLATSLHAISRTMGSRSVNRNVLFAASSLRSAANLLPMACEMVKWERNYVHLALFGRESIPLEEIMEINGITPESCRVVLHDARADYSEYSTDLRLEISVAGAMKHIQEFMHPQAIIMDDSAVEDMPFTRALRAKGKNLGRPVFEIPKGGYEEFLWITRLDSGSLGSWFKPKIDLLVHAPKESSGSLIRMLKSLEGASYAGLPAPRLTIELPNVVDKFVGSFLRGYHWPPSDKSGINTLTLRHRIPNDHATSEQSSLRFLESFFPVDAHDNHVLVLSPQVEISPQYLQYLYYVILEYRYSSYGAPFSGELMGISLDVPSTHVNGSGAFNQPTVADMQAQQYIGDDKLDKDAPAPFVYQAPSSTATLVFGDKWTTFHNFLSHRLNAIHSGKSIKPKKLVSETQPAWLEFMLELMRARGWHMLHPAKPFVTVHNELAQVPEEFVRESEKARKEAEQKGESEAASAERAKEEPYLTASEPVTMQSYVEREPVRSSIALHDILPFHGDLPELPHLPLLDYHGEHSSFMGMKDVREPYLQAFREYIGGCDKKQAARKPRPVGMTADDLFCLPGIEHEYETEDEDEAVAAAIIKAEDAA